MAYKKYIKKNGKVYGPYIYHSKRVGGKVVTEYQGSGKKNFHKKKILLISLLLVLVVGIFFFLFYSPIFTGQVVVDFQPQESGENFTGNLIVSLNRGELLPADSEVFIENGGNTYEYNLSDLIEAEKVNGTYYLEGVAVSGSGLGYGSSGIREEIRDVFFKIEIAEEVVVESGNVSGNESSEIIVETKVVQGDISKGGTFEYDLGGDFAYEIFDVRSEVGALNLSILNVEEEGQTLVITTNYSYIEEGFGQEYLMDEFVDYNIDFSTLDLNLVEGGFSFESYYLGDRIISYSTTLSSEEIVDENASEEEGEPSPGVDNVTNETGVDENMTFENDTGMDENITFENETIEANITEEIVVQQMSLQNISLTEAEKQVLRDNFDLIVINTTSFDYRDKIIVSFSLGGYNYENAYDSFLSNDELDDIIERDRLVWLKDLVKKFEDEDYSYEENSDFDSLYPIM